MKYIIFKQGTLLHPMVFAEHTSHCDVTLKNAKPISAGFVTFNLAGVEGVYGESQSLNLKNRGQEDVQLLQRMYLELGTMFFLSYD